MWLPLKGAPLFPHLAQIHFLLWDPTYRSSIQTVQLLLIFELSLTFIPEFSQSVRLGLADVH